MFKDLSAGAVANVRNERDQRQQHIDLNRGVTIRRHAGTGMQVFMYKDAPGEYMNAFGRHVPEPIAAQCGFPIEILRREKVRLQRMADAKIAIDKEFTALGPIKELVEQRDGYKLYLRGLGRFDIEDPDGNKLNEVPLSKEIAYNLLDNFAPQVVANAS